MRLFEKRAQTRQIQTDVEAIRQTASDRAAELRVPIDEGLFDGAKTVTRAAEAAGEVLLAKQRAEQSGVKAHSAAVLRGLLAIVETVKIDPGHRGFNTLITPEVTATLDDGTEVRLSYEPDSEYDTSRRGAARVNWFVTEHLETVPPGAPVPEEITLAMRDLGEAAGAGQVDSYLPAHMRAPSGLWGDVAADTYPDPAPRSS